MDEWAVGNKPVSRVKCRGAVGVGNGWRRGRRQEGGSRRSGWDVAISSGMGGGSGWRGTGLGETGGIPGSLLSPFPGVDDFERWEER